MREKQERLPIKVPAANTSKTLFNRAQNTVPTNLLSKARGSIAAKSVGTLIKVRLISVL